MSNILNSTGRIFIILTGTTVGVGKIREKVFWSTSSSSLLSISLLVCEKSIFEETLIIGQISHFFCVCILTDFRAISTPQTSLYWPSVTKGNCQQSQRRIVSIETEAARAIEQYKSFLLLDPLPSCLPMGYHFNTKNVESVTFSVSLFTYQHKWVGISWSHWPKVNKILFLASYLDIWRYPKDL